MIRVPTAHVITMALPCCILILRPKWNSIFIFNYGLSGSAELVLAANEEVDTDYGKESEYESHENADINESWYGGEESLQKFSHTLQLAHRTQRSQYPRRTQCLKATLVKTRCQAEN